MCCIAQTRHPAIRYESVREMAGNSAVFTSAECRAQAEAMLAQAERDPQHCRRLTTAAEAWLLLANQLRRLEASLGDDGKIPD